MKLILAYGKSFPPFLRPRSKASFTVKKVTRSVLKKIPSFISAIAIILLLSKPGWALDYVTWEPGTNPPSTATGDCAAYNIPAQAAPSKLGTYNDVNFNTTLRRITDQAAENIQRNWGIQYTSFSCGNSTGTMVAFNGGSGGSCENQVGSSRCNVFYDNNGNFLSNRGDFYYKPWSYTDDDEFRWSHDPSKPNIGYFRDKWYFCEYDYSAPAGSRVTLIKDFSKVYPDINTYGIQNQDKGEQSWYDGTNYDRYWAFVVQTTTDGYKYIICYDRLTDSIYELDLDAYYIQRGWELTNPRTRWVTMSPSGKYVIAKLYASNEPEVPYSKIITALFERKAGALVPVMDGANYRDISYGHDTGHPGWGYDAEGNEIFIWCDVLPDFTMFNLDTGQKTVIFSACNDCNECSSHQIYGGTHVSSVYNRNMDGWFFFTHYGNRTSSDVLSWLERELFAVRFSSDPSKVKVWRIASTRLSSSSYWNAGQARAQVSQNGMSVYFSTDFMNSHANGEIYRAELPSNWWSEIDGPKPNASSSATPTSGIAPLKVGFSGSGSDPSGTIVSYRWDFGDGATSDQQNDFHTYYAEGTYTAKLTVTNDKGVSATDSVLITVSGGAPQISVAANPATGEFPFPLEVNFDASASIDPNGYIVEYEWNFGDGSGVLITTNPVASHIYRNAPGGPIPVILTAKDNDGATSSASLNLEFIKATAPTIISVTGGDNASQVFVVFSEPVEEISATDTSNYSISDGMTVNSASLGSDLKTVNLTTSQHVVGATYTLTVNNIWDLASTPNVIAPNTQADYPFFLQMLISNFSMGSSNGYEIVQSGLQSGALVYTDRSFTYSSVPDWLQLATYIRTANDDKGVSNDSFMSFDVNQNVTVYVAYDIRIATKPSWLASFKNIDYDLVTTDTTLRLSAKNFSAGTVTLGGNEGSTSSSMYTIVIIPEATGPDIPPSTPTGLKILNVQ